MILAIGLVRGRLSDFEKITICKMAIVQKNKSIQDLRRYSTTNVKRHSRCLTLMAGPMDRSVPRLICMAAWRNGIASDYESGDCRFDPCGGHELLYFW